MLNYISVITRSPDTVPSYLGFGAEIIEQGKNEFGDDCLILSCPPEHSNWMATRLGSGMHGARIHVDEPSLNDWKKEWGYSSFSRSAQ